MPTTRFFRKSRRYWGIKNAQLEQNVVRILIGFEMLYREQDLNPIVKLFRRYYANKKNGNEKGWFYFENRNKNVSKLMVDAHSSIKEWKRNFIFVPAEKFPRGFW